MVSLVVAFICALVTFSGFLMGAISILQKFFEVGGSYSLALAGLIIWFIGTLFTRVAFQWYKDHNDKD